MLQQTYECNGLSRVSAWLLMNIRWIFFVHQLFFVILSKCVNNEPKVCISCDAGHYLCDFVFFKSLHSSQGKSLFIHVPPLNKPFSKEELAAIIVEVLEKVCTQIGCWKNLMYLLTSESRWGRWFHNIFYFMHITRLLCDFKRMVHKYVFEDQFRRMYKKFEKINLHLLTYPLLYIYFRNCKNPLAKIGTECIRKSQLKTRL